MPRMITEEFSFPIITGDNCNNVVHLTVLPPLWTRSPSYSCSASDHHRIIRRNKFFTRSFSHVETQLLLLKTQTREDVKFVETTETETEIAEEKMDMLWEDFNTNESLVPHPHNDHHRLQRQSPGVSVFSSPTCSSSPVVDLETLNHTSLSLSPLPSSDPHPISIMANTNCGDEKGKGKEKKLAGAGAPRGRSFEGELESRSRSNSLVMIVPKESKKMSKKKKKKKVVQESIVRMMKKFFLLKNISAFKFHKNKN